MIIYVCTVCGYVHNEKNEEDFLDSFVCPLCNAPKSKFEISTPNVTDEPKDDRLGVDKQYARKADDVETTMEEIHRLATEANSVIDAMGTTRDVVSWKDILLLGAQLASTPLLDGEDINCTTIIGKESKKPMVLGHPIIISHMSFGALSKEAKIALAKGSASTKGGQCSGEGGILPEEISNSYKYIFEYVPNKYSATDENLQRADAIEIKIGQGTKPGMGGHLPAHKVSQEIAKIRGKEMNKDIHSPSHFEEIKGKESLKDMIDELRKRSLGRPIGVKISAGNIEKDLEIIKYANPDFITIDGRGGATGASPKFLKDNMTVPTIYALARASKYMKNHKMNQQLIITGGLRTSSDFIKALALGADAVAIATSAMIAIGCQQYRICHNDKCPMGIATQNEELRSRFGIDKGAKRIQNYISTSLEEMKVFARVYGYKDMNSFNIENIVTTNCEISTHTDVKHA